MRNLFLLAGALVVVTGCGGGSGGGEPDAAVGGIYHGTMKFSDRPAADITGIVDEDGGVLFFMPTAGDVLSGTVNADGSHFSGALEQYRAKADNPYVTPSDGDGLSRSRTRYSDGTLEGTITSRSRFIGTYTGKDRANNVVSATFDLAYSNEYDVDPPRPDQLHPSAWNACRGINAARIVFISSKHDGSFTGGDGSGCAVDGRFTLIDAAFNAYGITYNSTCPDGTFTHQTGLAYYTAGSNENPAKLTVGSAYDQFAQVQAYTQGSLTELPTCN